jgi:nucleoside-diphosphate-sugar epimerase
VLGGTYNLASGSPVRIRDVAEMIEGEVERQTGQRPELIAPDPEGQPPTTFDVDVSKLTSLGLAPRTPLADAVAETVAFCVAHRDTLAEMGAIE